MTTPAVPLWNYKAKLARPHDGDTIMDVVVDCGFTLTLTPPHGLRILGINAPELHAADPAVKAKALAALAFVQQWLPEHAAHLSGPLTADWPFVIHTEKTDNFARLLARVECGQAHDLGEALVASGLAVPFMVNTP